MIPNLPKKNKLTFSTGSPKDDETVYLFKDAIAIYSLRSIGNHGFSPVVRVRRDSDNSEKDFSANEVHSNVLVDFVGSGNGGFVETWYDQSGNGNHLIQATGTKQPSIVTSGALNKRNNRPIVKFIQANENNLTNANTNMFPTGSNIAATVFQAMHIDSSSGNRLGIFGSNGGGNNAAANGYRFGSGTSRRVIIKFANASATQVEFNSSSLSNNADSILTYLFTANGGTGTLQVFDNGSAQAEVSKSITDQSYGPSHVSSGLILGARTVSDNFSDSEFFEVIAYDSNQTSNRVLIETNMNDTYNIF